MDAKKRYMCSVLKECICAGDLDRAHELLKKGADPNFVLDDGACAFHIAVGLENEYFSEQFTKLLLEYGGDPNVRSSEGSTPLHCAAAYGRCTNLKLLLEHGGDPDLLDEDNMTAYDNVRASQCEMCRIYLQLHVEKKQKNGHHLPSRLNTPLQSTQSESPLMYSLHRMQDSNDTILSNNFTIETSPSIDDDNIDSPEDICSRVPASPEDICSRGPDSPEDICSRGPARSLNYTIQVQGALDKFSPTKHYIDVTSPDHPTLVSRMLDDTVQEHTPTKSPQGTGSSSSGSFVTCPNSPSLLESSTGSVVTQIPMHGHTMNNSKDSHKKTFTESVIVSAKGDQLHETIENITVQSSKDSFGFNPAELPTDICQESDTSTFLPVLKEIQNPKPDAKELLETQTMMKDLSLMTEDDTVLCEEPKVPHGARYATRYTELSPKNSIDSGAVSDYWSDFYSSPRTSSLCHSIGSSTSSRLSRASKNSRTSSCSSCSVRTECYQYTDKEDGYSLIETRLLPMPGDISCDENCTAHSITSVNDWKEASILSQNESVVSLVIPGELEMLNNTELHSRLTSLGDVPGPITDTTRRIYLRRLLAVLKDPDLAGKNTATTTTGFLSEIQKALRGELDLSSPELHDLETKMFEPFVDPDPKQSWREGTQKSSFTYLLLDPRVTMNLPVRSKSMEANEAFEVFLRAVFYIGKGKRSRPYAHFKEAIHHITKPSSKEPGRKVLHILDIWQAGQGVISLHVFQNVIPSEAYTREACMIEAFGLPRLTNKVKGQHYGPASTWLISRRRTLGVYLLKKAYKILLCEGERQIKPHDIKNIHLS